MATKTGTNNNDILQGSGNADQLAGLAGDDVLYGDRGNDFLDGGLGDDFLDGALGADTLSGGDGNDRYLVDNAADSIIEKSDAEEQLDTVETYIEDYRLGKNLENLQLGYGNTFIKGTGNSLQNEMWGNEANNILYGLAGDDYFYGANGSDTLYGGTGNDTVDGAAGADLLYGGAGADGYWVDNVDDRIVETIVSTARSEQDTVFAWIDYTLPANVENIELWPGEGGGPSTGLNAEGNGLNNRMSGNSFDNRLSGLEGGDTLMGGIGVDTLEGGAGNDKLDGGAGGDAMFGGSGDDYYWLDNVADSINEAGNNGNDTVESWLSNYTLAATLENIVLLQENWQINYIAQNGYGNSLNNKLQGNSAINKLNGFSGNDWLNGMGGADTLNGGAGNDTLQGGRYDNDVFVFDSALNATGNVDQIVDFETGYDKIRLDNDIFNALNATTGLTSGQFIAGDNQKTAQDANDFIIYNSTSGAVYYDADGNGGASQPVQFIGMGVGLALTANDFVIIS